MKGNIIKNFEDFGLSKEMLETLVEIRYQTASDIQAAVIPEALKGKDIIGQAHTGTGKTAAFGIPIIERTEANKKLQSIILAPSRELAVQIFTELKKLSDKKKIKIIEIIGGISYTKQERDIKSKPEIIVATPGRLIDHLEKKRIDLSGITTFALDEADEMLNFGFLKEIKKIASFMPKEKQTYFLTATFNKKIETLAKELLNNPFSVKISSGLSTGKTVEQKYVIVKEKQKLKTLVSFLQLTNPVATIIFGKTRRRVDELSAALAKLGYKVKGIQGDLRQRERSKAMEAFRNGEINILVGTDVMARGIDVDNVDYVYNFDLPTEIEYYTHRIGRTGRAKRKGIAVSFVKDMEIGYFKQIMKLTQSEVEKWPIPTDKDLAEIKETQIIKESKNLLVKGKANYQNVADKLMTQFTENDLALIVAASLIKDKAQVYGISLTGEAAITRSGGGQRSSRSRGSGNSRNSRHGSGNFRNSRNSSNGSRNSRSGGSNYGKGKGGNDRRGKSGNGSQSRGNSNRKRTSITGGNVI